MKKGIFAIFFFALMVLGISLQAKNIQAYLNYSTFMVPGKGPFIETYLSVAGESVIYVKNDNGQLQGSIEVTFIFRQDGEIKDFDKYQLFSPEVADTGDINFSFLDQQRYFIPQGEYEMEIIINDLNAGKKPFSAIQPVTLKFDEDEVCFSGIQLVKSFSASTQQNITTKGGYDLIPMIYNFYPESTNKLTYYTEIYNSDKTLGPNEKFLVVSQIKSFETGNSLKDFASYKKYDAKQVIPVLNEYDISRLPSGNYLIMIEVRNKLNELVAKNELFIQRSNPNIQFAVEELAAIDVNSTFANKITSNDTLLEYIKCLDPIATELEKTYIHKQSESSELKTKQQFFYSFWFSRDQLNPEKAWREYYEQVLIVDAAYRTQISEGYETDRGRVYLKYGPPNIISESYNEPSSYPYEIWHYYQLGDNQRNKKFVFYSTDMLTNSFVLLHSDAIGEVSNYKWQIFLNSRWYDPYNVDADKAPSIYGSEVEDYYRNPR
jgi:GWxTD domain-containing protein